MKIITLMGASNIGKTNTLKKLIFQLVTECKAVLLDVKGGTRCSTYISPSQNHKINSMMSQSGDVFVKLEIGGKKYGISTAGDTKWHIESKLQLLLDCDYFVCASRDTGETYTYICGLEINPLYTVKKVFKIGNIVSSLDQTHQNVQYIFDYIAVDELKKYLDL